MWLWRKALGLEHNAASASLTRSGQTWFKIEAKVAEIILARKDLSYVEIGRLFGISESTVKEIIKRRGVNPQRKSGPKPKSQSAIKRG